MSFKKKELVMLPTEKATWPNCIWLGRISGQLRLDTSYNYSPKSIEPFDNSMLPQHLYILSDEEIKEGDWCVIDLKENSRVTKVISLKGTHPEFNVEIEEGYAKLESLKKIIATTDTKLKISTFYEIEGNQKINLPTFSQSFLEVFVREYNKGNQIKWVMVEYEDCGEFLTELEDCPWSENLQLYVKPDNTISIRKLKDSWSREELQIFKNSGGNNHLRFIYDRLKYVHNENPNYDYMHKLESICKWIEENL